MFLASFAQINDQLELPTSPSAKRRVPRRRRVLAFRARRDERAPRLRAPNLARDRAA
jgi:hypothetical protein